MAATTGFICWCSVGFVLLFLMAALAFINERIHYYIKMSIYYIILMFVALLMIPISCFRPCNVDNQQIASWLYTFAYQWMGVNVKLRGFEQAENTGPMVVIGNHQSSIDVIMMMKMWLKRCTVLAKKELIFAGTFGVAIWLTGAVFIDRLNRERAMNTMVKLASDMKKNNWKLWIFPEGTRNHVMHGMLPFKKGAFFLAIQAQIPILPIVTTSYETFYSRKKRFGSGDVIVTCLPPVSTAGLTADDVDTLIDRVRQQMFKVYEETSAEVKSAALAAAPNKKHD